MASRLVCKALWLSVLLSTGVSAGDAKSAGQALLGAQEDGPAASLFPQESTEGAGEPSDIEDTLNGAVLDEVPVGRIRRFRLQDGGAMFISEDGRYVFKGEIIDLWNLNRVSETGTVNRIDLRRNGIDINRVAVTLGKGKPLTIFSRPDCPDCKVTLQHALDWAQAGKGRLDLVLVAVNGREGELNDRIRCATNPAAALRQVIGSAGPRESELRYQESCDRTKGLLSEELAVFVGITRFPTVILDDGRALIGSIKTFE